ncbi:class I adenylate-forming enzyme family protein [Labedaea rhizosphaerae]|uniref:Long-chain acyl-CoA synthetase n=1 Tax=Labedaea rhizosphaerae TaxID=598644 RepID=A0A4R6SC55_LABRH|nr:class I adenylate-forming enzyme family protein [Labedaea rhizosphaerae]TDP96606.1 long-chain acyl-CoA synthetase [Labedaea rhizosphaerae]
MRVAVSVPLGPVDALPRLAAQRWPDRVAVSVANGDKVTYAQLEKRVSRLAGGLRALLGADDAVVAVSSVAGMDFPVAYYAVMRSGNVVAPVNPVLPADVVVRLLATSGAVAALLAPHVYEAVAPLLHRAPKLRHVMVLGADEPIAMGSVTSGRAPDEATAAIMFTSGSTGPAKGVRLSHRNLKAGAAQLGAAHDLTEGTVVVNALPIYHPMHLNAGVLAGVTQVLAGPEPVAAVRTAANVGATHFYALPFQLTRLAGHTDFGRLAAPTVRIAACGGLPLPSSIVDKLTCHFGFRLLQGYGLTETAGLAHSDLVGAPKQGTVGPALAAAQTRVVGLETGAVLAPGAIGEVQVRGPQVFVGYLDAPAPLDAEGWFATGDAGFVDEDGYLTVIDRVRDLFRVGATLVSPASIERRLHAHPDVRECAVVGLSGLGAAALVVPRGPVDADALLGALNAGASHAEAVRRAVTAPAIPRLANGKVDKDAVRARLADSVPVVLSNSS